MPVLSNFQHLGSSELRAEILNHFSGAPNDPKPDVVAAARNTCTWRTPVLTYSARQCRYHIWVKLNALRELIGS